MAWILLCKGYKLSAKISNNYWDNEFFLKDCFFIGAPCIWWRHDSRTQWPRFPTNWGDGGRCQGWYTLGYFAHNCTRFDRDFVWLYHQTFYSLWQQLLGITVGYIVNIFRVIFVRQIIVILGRVLCPGPSHWILATPRAGFKGEGARGPGPQASHQQGASHQTLHIFFVRDMCVRDFRLLQSPN